MRAASTWSIVVVAVAAGLSGCTKKEETPAPPPGATTASPPAHETSNPVAGGGQLPGKPLYDDNCMSCHGTRGAGDGPGAGAIQPHPRDLSDPKVQASLDDARLADIIKRGGAAGGLSQEMPAFGATLSDEQIAQIVAYVRTLRRQ